MTDKEKKDIIVNEILIPSLHILYNEDYTNILWNVSERNICARLAHHMENIMRSCKDNEIFQEYFADVEYNRVGNESELKFYKYAKEDKKYMVSDLLIHRRGVMSNYLAVEMKYKGNRKGMKTDKKRLKAMVSTNYPGAKIVFGTLVGAFITYSPQDMEIELFDDVKGEGQEVEKLFFSYGISGLKMTKRLKL